ncbi:MAG: hypothetical protein FWG58_03095 [Methanomassiliicoccaceae archaeon]|nr:hypothetical protein [Methanomassiliicoccaceae archaeon]
METDGIAQTLAEYPMPEAILTIGGILAVLLAILYLKDDGIRYKLLMVIGMLFGIVMAVTAFNTYGTTDWAMSTSVIMIVASFTLIIRPFKEVHFAVLIALLVMGIVYIVLGGFADHAQLHILAEGWWRIGIALVAGAIVYSLLHMLESIVKLIAKVLNAWPVLLLLGLVCVIEGIMVFMHYGSVYDLITSYTEGKEGTIGLMMNIFV